MVINVESLLMKIFCLKQIKGILNIKGEKMYMKQLNLDAGLIVVEGIIRALNYHEGSSSKQREKVYNRLFR